MYCNGVIIGSQLVIYGRTGTSVNNADNTALFQAYNIIETGETLDLVGHSGQTIGGFGMKDPIFFLADDNFPSLSCNVGFRVENDICVDIDECRILRHYCDFGRKRLI